MYILTLRNVIKHQHNILSLISNITALEAIFLTPGHSFFGVDVLHQVTARTERLNYESRDPTIPILSQMNTSKVHVP